MHIYDSQNSSLECGSTIDHAPTSAYSQKLPVLPVQFGNFSLLHRRCLAPPSLLALSLRFLPPKNKPSTSILSYTCIFINIPAIRTGQCTFFHRDSRGRFPNAVSFLRRHTTVPTVVSLCSLSGARPILIVDVSASGYCVDLTEGT